MYEIKANNALNVGGKRMDLASLTARADFSRFDFFRFLCQTWFDFFTKIV
jgi:hypothetical protein